MALINSQKEYQEEIDVASSSLRKAKTSFDLWLVCYKSKKAIPDDAIKVNQFALASLSSVLHNVLAETSQHKNNDLMIVLEGFDPLTVRKLVEYVYEGTINIKSEKMEELLELCELLKIDIMKNGDVLNIVIQDSDDTVSMYTECSQTMSQNNCKGYLEDTVTYNPCLSVNSKGEYSTAIEFSRKDNGFEDFANVRCVEEEESTVQEAKGFVNSNQPLGLFNEPYDDIKNLVVELADLSVTDNPLNIQEDLQPPKNYFSVPKLSLEYHESRILNEVRKEPCNSELNSIISSTTDECEEENVNSNHSNIDASAYCQTYYDDEVDKQQIQNTLSVTSDGDPRCENRSDANTFDTPDDYDIQENKKMIVVCQKLPSSITDFIPDRMVEKLKIEPRRKVGRPKKIKRKLLRNESVPSKTIKIEGSSHKDKVKKTIKIKIAKTKDSGNIEKENTLCRQTGRLETRKDCGPVPNALIKQSVETKKRRNNLTKQQCSHCSYACWGDKHDLDIHIKTRHDIIKDVKCSMCSYVTTLQIYLHRHLKGTHGAATNYCDRCSYCTPRVWDLLKHKQRMHGANSMGLKKVKKFKHCESKASKQSPYVTNQLLKLERDDKQGHKIKIPAMPIVPTVKNKVKKKLSGKEINYLLDRSEGTQIHCTRCSYKSDKLWNVKRHIVTYH